MTMPAVPDAHCYQLAMECCVAGGRNDEALSLLTEMEGRGLSPNEAGLRALIRGFAAEGVGCVGGGGGGGEAAAAGQRWRGVENALGVFEELAERFQPPSRCVCVVVVGGGGVLVFYCLLGVMYFCFVDFCVM